MKPNYRKTARRFISATALPKEPKVQQHAPVEADVITSALRAGIKSIAIGKEGTKPIPEHLFSPIAQELQKVSQIDISSVEQGDGSFNFLLLRASFMGSLFVKAKLGEGEMRLLNLAANERTAKFAEGRVRQGYGMKCSAGEVLRYVSIGEGDSVLPLKRFAIRLLNGEPLAMEDAKELGTLLYSTRTNDVEGMPVKALIAHVMRIRHESAEELAGLACAAHSTLSPAFVTDEVPNCAPFVHIAEPFDGTITWDILTPLLARHVKETYKFNTVLATGKSAGPKYGPNLRDIAGSLGVPFSRNWEELLNDCEACEFGAAVDQSDCSEGLSAWVYTRRVILKRPSLATVEKYIDVSPNGAAVFIASAFHTAYIEKMACAAEALHFPTYIIVGKGMEGTTGLGVGPRRTGTLLVGLRDSKGSYSRENIEFNVKDAGIAASAEEPAKGCACADANARKILAFTRTGTSGDYVFDARVKTTLAAFDRAFGIIILHLDTIATSL